MDLITIGCKLPHGIWLEVGIEHVEGVWGASIRGPKYARVLLNGTHAEFQKKAPTIQPVATLNPEPGLTQIPKQVWDDWIAPPTKSSRGGMGYAHPARKNNLIFVVPDEKAEATAVLQAVESLRTGFEPIDPNNLPKDILEAPVEGRPQLGKTPVRKD
jgi:hypothetical protein